MRGAWPTQKPSAASPDQSVLTWKVPKSIVLIFKFAAKSMPADPLRKAPKLRASRYTKNILVHVIGVARLVEKALIAKTHEMVRVD
jgi:hypothetical protein